MITGAQLRGARALLRWSAEETAKRVKVTRKTIERLEQADGPLNARALTIDSIRQVFEEAGVEFIGNAEEGPGLRLWGNSRPGGSS